MTPLEPRTPRGATEEALLEKERAAVQAEEERLRRSASADHDTD
jgi:hypothetical protein